METEVVTIQEPVSTKKNVEEAHAGVDKVNLSTVLDDEITSQDCGNNTILGEADVVNGSGNKETEESEREKGEAMKTISVEEDNKIVKEKASETEKDEQDSIFVHEPESFNKNIEEDQTDTKVHSPEQEEEIGTISKVLIDENDIEKSLNSTHEEILIKTDEVNEGKDSRSDETSVNETEDEHKATVSVEEISRNGENIVNETVPEEETATDGETTKSVLLEVKNEEEEEAEVKTDAEPLIKTVLEDVNNEETTAHESESLKENEIASDAEQIPSEVTIDKEKEEGITQNREEEQESVSVIETQAIQEEKIESNASSLDHEEEEKDKSSKDTEEHEHVFVRDIPQVETLVTEAESVDTSTVQEAEILKSNVNETEANSAMGGEEEEGQETKENTKPSQDLKEDKEQEETEISSDEVRSSDVQVEEFGEPSSLEIKDESHGREETVDVKTKETIQEEINEKKHENLHDVASLESVKSQDNEPETALVTDTESQEKFEETPSDLAINVDKEELKDEKIKEEQRGIDSNGAEEEQVDQNRTEETEESPVAKLVVLPDVEESVEQMQTPSIESASEISEETSKTVDEKIEEKPEEEVTMHQEGQEKGSYGLETKEEIVSVPESIELGEKSLEEKSVIDINLLQEEESSVPNEQEKETKLETHEPRYEEVKVDEVLEGSSALPSKELEGETVVETEKIESIKENEEEQAGDKIPKSLETVDTAESHSSLPSSLEEEEHGTVSEKIEDDKVKEEESIVESKSEEDATKSHERQEDFSESVEETTVVQAEQTRDIEPFFTEKCSMDESQPEERSADEQKKEVSKDSESIVNETYALHSAEAAEEETATNGESPQQDVEITKRVLVEVEKDAEEAEMKTDAEPIEKEEIETLKTVAEEEEAKIVNNEDTTAYESTSLKGDDHHDENAELVEEIKNSDDAEQISHEVTVDKEMEEDMTQKTETVQESSKLIETPTTQGEDIESKASPDHEEEIDKISKDTEENEHVLGKDIPQCETLEVEAVEENEDTKPSLDKEDEEQEVTETAKTVIFSDEVRPSDQIDVQVEELSEHIEPCSSEIKDESHGREESVEVKTKEIVQEESTEEKHENRLDVPSTESEKYHLQKPSLESPSEVSEETSKIIDENIEEKSEEETVAVQESKKLGEQAHEERSLIDLTPLQEKETKLEKHELTNEEIKSDEVIEVSSASLSKELEVETVVQAEKIENIKDNEEDQAEDKIQKSVETVEAHSSLPSSLDEKEHGTVSEKIEDEKVNEEEPIVQIKSEDDTTKSHERQEDQTRDIEPSLTEKCSMDQSQPEEQVKEACSRDEQEKEISKNSENTENETYASHSTEAAAEEEESATNGESPLHDVETTKSVLLEVEKEAEMKTEEIESVEDAKIVDNEETAAHESESLQEDTHEEENAEEISREVTVDRETEEDITRKTEKVQESSMVIETPTTQGDGIESKASLELKEEAEQSSKETKEHELVLERDIPQFETLEIEAVDTSTVQEAAILKTLETNTNETEEVHSEIGGAEESQEIKEDTETSMDLKVDKEKKEAETLKTVIFSDEVKLSDQVDAQEEELGEETGTYSSEIKDESQGREESVEVKSKETVQDENIEKCQENEPGTTLVSKIESQEKSEEVLLDLTLKDELKDEKTKADQNMEVLRGLDLNEPEAEQIDQNRTDGTEESPVEKLVAVEDELVEKLQKPSLETSSELSEKTSKTVDEKIEDKPEEEETLHQEDQETKEETVSVPNEKETETKLQEKNEPTNEEVSNDQQSLVEETSDEVIQVSSASPSEGPEDETVVEAEKIVDKKVDEEEQVAEKIQDSLETVEKVEPQSSLQEHGTVSEKTDDEKLKEAEPMGDMSEKGLEIAETTDLSLPSVDQTKDIKAFDEELQISSVAVPLDDEQEKVTSTEKEETKANETAEAKKGDEEITRITSKTSENVCIQQEEFEKIEAPKLEESQKDIAETIKAVEATSDQTLPIETSDAEEKDQTPKEVEEIHEEETKEAYKLQAEEILPTEIIPRESSDEALTSMLASKESEDEVTETKDTQEEQSASVETEESVGETKPKEPEDEHVETPASPIILEKNDTEILIAEANLDEFKNPEALKLEESKEDKSQEILEIAETIEATNNQTELVSRLDDQTPKHVEEIHETSQEHQTSDLASELDDQITKQVEEVHEEETKEEHKLKVAVDQILPVETSEADQTSSLVSEILGEETKETHKIQADETVPREPFSEAERREKSDDQVETSNKLSEVEDEDTKKTDIEVAEHEDENSSNLPVVEILKGLHTTLETEREVNDSASSGENLIIEPADQEQKKGDPEVESNEKDSASDIIEELQEEDKEEVKVQDDISRELQEETREISESKEEVPADLSLTEDLPVVKILTPSSPLPSEEQEHVISEDKQEEREPQQDVNASTSEKEKKAETHENVKEEYKIVDIKEEKKNEEEQDEKLWDSAATRDIEEIFSTEVKDDKEVNSVLRSEEETNEVVISEKQITDPAGVVTKAREAEHESNEEHIETQVILDDTKSDVDRDFPTEQALKDQEDEVSADKSVTKEAPVEQIHVPSLALLDDQDLSVKKPSEIIQPHQSPNQVEETSFEFKKTEEEEDKNEETGDALIVKENVQVQDQPKEFEASVTDKESSEQEEQSNDLKEDIGANVKDDDEVRSGLIEEKKEVEQVKTELEDAIKHGVLVEEKNNKPEKIEREATKEIFQEENKQTNTVNEEIREEEMETKQECFKKTDDETDFTQTETRDIESLSSVSKTQDKPEQKDEVPKIAEEVHKKDGESKNKKDLLSEVKESEPREEESARKSLSNLIQKVKGTTKSEDATKEPHIKEEPKTEEEEEESEEGDHEHNKDDKTSPDSIVMVEAKDTVSIIKTHKKSQGILSGVGSKVKHSISKVKKVLTGKSSHTTKPSSPK